MEAILLAGGKAERLGEAAQGRPKALVDVAGRPLAAYQVAQLAAAGVDRVIISCAAGAEEQFERELSGIGPEIAAAGEPDDAATAGERAASPGRPAPRALPDFTVVFRGVAMRDILLSPALQIAHLRSQTGSE